MRGNRRGGPDRPPAPGTHVSSDDIPGNITSLAATQPFVVLWLCRRLGMSPLHGHLVVGLAGLGGEP
jgi:hypothetical protein